MHILFQILGELLGGAGAEAGLPAINRALLSYGRLLRRGHVVVMWLAVIAVVTWLLWDGFVNETDTSGSGVIVLAVTLIVALISSVAFRDRIREERAHQAHDRVKQ